MKNNYGFTLMELLMAIGIVAIIAGIASPNYIKFKRSRKVSVQAVNIVSAIQNTKSNAVKRNSTIYVNFPEIPDKSVKMIHNFAWYGTPPTIFSSLLSFDSRGIPNVSGTITISVLNDPTIKKVVVSPAGNVQIN